MTRYIFVFTVMILSSCSYDNLEEYYSLSECETNEATFSGDVQPIIAANCAIPTCHVQGTGLPAWSDYEKISARAADIRLYTSSGFMPPASSGKSLSIEQVRKIACWVDAGAKNN